MQQTYMKEKKILPLVLSMSIPMALSMLVNALYNIVDSYFVAQISEKAMTALSLVFPLQNVSGAVAIGFGVGANAVTAFFMGQNDKKAADGTASLSLLLSFVHSVILTADSSSSSDSEAVSGIIYERCRDSIIRSAVRAYSILWVSYLTGVTYLREALSGCR